MRSLASALALLALAACHSGPHDGADMPGDSKDHQPFGEVAPDELLRFAGTEPFWGGEVRGDQMTYKTPDQPDGRAIAVSRFAGRGGLSFSGTMDGAAFTMTVTAGTCSDGMSDRSYPFVVTLQQGDASRTGCAWSDKHPFKETAAP